MPHVNAEDDVKGLKTTTLSELRQKHACEIGYRKLLAYLGEDYPKDKPIDYGTIAESNGIRDAFWALRNTASEEKWLPNLSVEFACDCADRVIGIYEKEHPDNKAPREAIALARKFLAHPSEVTREELIAARRAARNVAADVAADAAARNAAADAAAYAADAADAAYAAAYAADAADAAAAAAAAAAAERVWQLARFKELLETATTEERGKV